MSEDVKPRIYYIVDSTQLNNQPTRIYNIEPKWLAGAVEVNKVIELEPTLQLMKEMGEAFNKINEAKKMFMQFRDAMYVEVIDKESKDALEKYRKFKDGLK